MVEFKSPEEYRTCSGLSPFAIVGNDWENEPNDFENDARVVGMDARHAIVFRGHFTIDENDEWWPSYSAYLVRKDSNGPVTMAQDRYRLTDIEKLVSDSRFEMAHDAERLNSQYAIWSMSFASEEGCALVLAKIDVAAETIEITDLVFKHIHYMWESVYAVVDESTFYWTYNQSEDPSPSGEGDEAEKTTTIKMRRDGDSLIEEEVYEHSNWAWPEAYPDGGQKDENWRQIGGTMVSGDRLVVLVSAANWGNFDLMEGEDDYLVARLMDLSGSMSLIADFLFQVELRDPSGSGGLLTGDIRHSIDHYQLDDERMILVSPRWGGSGPNDTYDVFPFRLTDSDEVQFGGQTPVHITNTHYGQTPCGAGWLVGHTHYDEDDWGNPPPAAVLTRFSVIDLTVTAGTRCAVIPSTPESEKDTGEYFPYDIWASDSGGGPFWVMNENYNDPIGNGVVWLRTMEGVPPLRFEQRDDWEFVNNPNDPRITTGGQAPTTRQNSIRHSGQTYW